MDDVRRSIPVHAAALLGVALLACRSDAGKPPAEGTAGPPPATQAAVTPAAPPPAPPAAVPISLAPEVRATCAAVARFWSKFDSTQVRQVDSVVAPWATETTVSACLVFAYKEHSLLRNAKVTVDSTAERLGTALALVRSTGRGWVPLYKMSADGPDGSDLGYQKGRVRCLVEQSWDGGDDSDTTYVPADWFKEQTTCWLMPGTLTPSDTSSFPTP